MSSFEIQLFLELYTCIRSSELLSSNESACNSGDTGDEGLISGLGRSPEGGNVNPLQYSCPENPMAKEQRGREGYRQWQMGVEVWGCHKESDRTE